MFAVFHKQDGEWYFDGSAEDPTELENANADRGFDSKTVDLDPVAPTP